MTAARRLIRAGLMVMALSLAAGPSRAVEIKLLPANTEIVVRLNIKQILNSELGKTKGVQEVIKELQKGFETMPGNELAVKFLAKIGLNPARDLTALTLAHSGSKNPEDMFIMLEGNFEPAKIEATARDAAKAFNVPLAFTRLNDHAVFEVKTDQGKVFIGLLGKKVIVATGSQEAMKEAINRSLARKPAVLKKDMIDLLKTFNDKQSMSVVASSRVVSSLTKGTGLPTLDGGLSGSITLAKEMTFQIGVAAKDQATARDIVDKGNLGMFALRALLMQQAQQNPQLAPAVDVANSLRLVDVGSNAILEGEVSYETVQQIFKNLNNQLNKK